MTATIRLTNWAAHQHYKDRDPPWIKLYRDILTSEPWLVGTDSSRLVQLASILLAARYQNAIPCNLMMIKKAANLDMSELALRDSIEFLVNLKFLEIHGLKGPLLAPCYQDASNLLDQRRDRGRGEAETEAELRGTQVLPTAGISLTPPGITVVGPARKRISRSRPDCRLPDDFSLTETRREYANEHGVNAQLAFDMFTTYWRAKGSNATKRNWDAAWQHWVLKDSHAKAAKAAPKKTRYDEIMEMQNGHDDE